MKLPTPSIKAQKQNLEMTCTKWHLFRNIIVMICCKVAENRYWSYITSASRGECEGKSKLYCQAAWHQHLNAIKKNSMYQVAQKLEEENQKENATNNL